MHSREPRVVLWAARATDIQLGGSSDRVTQISQQLDDAVRASYDSVRQLGELTNPLDVADPGRW